MTQVLSAGGRNLWSLRQLAVCSSREESEYRPFVKGSSNPPEHGQRVPFVVGIFKLADDRRRRTHQFGQLALGQPGLRTQVVDFAGDFCIC